MITFMNSHQIDQACSWKLRDSITHQVYTGMIQTSLYCVAPQATVEEVEKAYRAERARIAAESGGKLTAISHTDTVSVIKMK